MKQKFSAAGLKTLAIIAMTVDHSALLFVPQDSLLYWFMRMFGRLTAPIMAFFIAEGFRHTHSAKKYLARLCAFAVIAQPFYFLLCFGRAPTNLIECLINMNVMFTLAVALLSLILLNSKLPQLPKLLLLGCCISLAQFGDWTYLIPVWTLIFFYCKENPRRQALLFALASVSLQTMLYLKYFDSFALFSFQYGTLLALIPLRMYNGQSGGAKHKKRKRWLFYIYYPLHMAVLIFIRIMLA